MKLNFLVITLISQFIFSQNFNYNTQYTLNYNFEKVEDFEKENFNFSYDEKNKVLSFIDLDLNIKKNLCITYFNSDYSDDLNFYIKGYYSNKKIDDIFNLNNGKYAVVLLNFDKKLGQLTHIIIEYTKGEEIEESVTDKNTVMFFTEYGKKYYIEKYFTKN